MIGPYPGVLVNQDKEHDCASPWLVNQDEEHSHALPWLVNQDDRHDHAFTLTGKTGRGRRSCLTLAGKSGQGTWSGLTLAGKTGRGTRLRLTWLVNQDEEHDRAFTLAGTCKSGQGTQSCLTLAGFTGIPGRSDGGVATALILAEPISCSSVPACSSFFSASRLLPRTSPMASAPVVPNWVKKWHLTIRAATHIFVYHSTLKSTFSQPFKDKCTSEEVRIWQCNHLSCE